MAHNNLFPEWVHQLHALGLETITISYHEDAPAVQDWNMDPVQLCCHLSCTYPVHCVVRGPPCTTKMEAMKRAVRRLELEILAGGPALVQETHVTDTKTGNNDDESYDAVRIKTALLRCEDHKIRFVHCQPSWAAAPFDTDSQPFGYLYELVIQTKGSSYFTTGPSSNLVSNKLGLEPSQATRMGILFPRDIEPYRCWAGPNHDGSAAYQTDFVFRDPQSGQEMAVVELKHRTVVDSMDPEELIKLIRFNRGMVLWKEYGLGKNGRSRTFSETTPAVDSGTPPDGGRTYLFVPLTLSNTDRQDLSIHWDLVHLQLADRPMPFLDVPRSSISFLPVLGNLELENVAVSSLGVVAAILTRNFFYTVHLSRGFSFMTMLYSMERLEFCIVAAVTLLCYSAWASSRLPPIRNVSTNDLKNRFLLHRGMLYVVALNQGDQLSAHSPFPTPAPEDLERKEDYKQKYGLDLFKATFADYFLLKYGIRVRYPTEKLIAVHLVENNKHISCNPLISVMKQHVVHLLPELTEVLPMPRDLLYNAALAETYMPILERLITTSTHSFVLLESGMNFSKRPESARQQLGKQIPAKPYTAWLEYHTMLVGLLLEATNLYPIPLYKRLEFLGDAVLGFTLALNLVVRQNSALQWDNEDLTEMHTLPAKNITLRKSAHCIGLIRLLQFKHSHWRSAYIQRRPNVSAETGELADNALSDVVESMLAAVYLSGRKHTSLVSLVIAGILDKLELPVGLPTVSARTEYDPTTGSMQRLEPRANLCLDRGLDLDDERDWNHQLVEIDAILRSRPILQAKLHRGVQILWRKLSLASGVERTEQSFQSFPQSVAIVSCALFDTDLMDLTNIVADADVDPGPLEQLALFRDSLYHIGVHAFKLVLSDEVFRRFPQAAQEDLHLLRNVAFTEDVVAYIMMKSGMRLALLDDTPYHEFEQTMQVSDSAGRLIWEQYDGWMLPGGMRVFHERMVRLSQRKHLDASLLTPQYPGLGGGRLVGHDAKLPVTVTDELAFSFKAIVGGLVLAVGLQEMWEHVGPLFDELLLLSPVELREQYRWQSSLVRSAAAGK